jgi:hypothetical protein
MGVLSAQWVAIQIVSTQVEALSATAIYHNHALMSMPSIHALHSVMSATSQQIMESYVCHATALEINFVAYA